MCKAEAAAGDTLSVAYTGSLADGTVFDTSRAHRNGFSFVVGAFPLPFHYIHWLSLPFTAFHCLLGAGQVIPAWDAALIGVRPPRRANLLAEEVVVPGRLELDDLLRLCLPSGGHHRAAARPSILHAAMRVRLGSTSGPPHAPSLQQVCIGEKIRVTAPPEWAYGALGSLPVRC